MFQNLRKVYGFISSKKGLNLFNMERAWIPVTPLEAVYTQLAEGCEFSAAGGKILPETLVMIIGSGIIDLTGIFPETC